MRILFIGDVVAGSGRECVRALLPALREEQRIDLAVANGENAAGGLGATPQVIRELVNSGVQAVTMGNHTWRKKELLPEIDALPLVVRPANYPAGVPGRGSVVVELPDGRRAGIVSLLGRVYMEPFDCPFATGKRVCDELRAQTPVVLVDFHAEATAEKAAMAWHLDGACTAIVGTHTHVQTADERIMPKGTAFITDVGMTGPQDSVIGLDAAESIRKFTTGLPGKHTVAEGRPALCGVIIDADDASGKANTIERVYRENG
ncbi:MAG: TIGR00282 family metallophosphoesterase [Candidatus Hydrogenedentes bacterium]|nr:TIGR00282 family metallophosphoesterase [Candidatus Hydrogenedentota bacterium]